MLSFFLASIDVIEFHRIEAYSSLDLISVMYNINKLFRVKGE
jgi:hypothetical protein